MQASSWIGYAGCATCGAAGGWPCHSRTGGRLASPHAGRPVDPHAKAYIRPAPTVVTRTQRDILAHYFRGAPADDIAKRVRCKPRDVVGLIERIGYSRQHARELVLVFDETHLNKLRLPRQTPSAPPPSPRIVVTRIPAHPATEESTMDASDLMSTDTLLKTAETCGIPKAERLAKLIKVKLGDLGRLMQDSADKLRLAAEIADLNRQLAQKKAALATANGKPATPAAPEEGTRDNKAIRAWATTSGITCPAHGRIPGYVIDAYDKAHTGS